MAIRVVISDSNLAHGESVRNAVIAGHGFISANEIEIRAEPLGNCLTYAQLIGAEAVVRSYTGVAGWVPTAHTFYPNQLVFMPLGSNSFTELTALDTIPVIVTAGASNTANNETGYGLGLEFFDDDNGEGGDTDLSSFSNGIICGKLLRIKDLRGGSWWDARYSASMTASRNGVWNKFNGYGKIDVLSAVAFNGTVITDPYLPAPPPPPPPPPPIIEETAMSDLDKRISGMQPITAVQIAANDVIPLIDVSEPVLANKNKIVTHANLAASLGAIPGLQQCIGILSQDGTDAPSMTVFVNSTGGAISFSREGVGLYTMHGFYFPEGESNLGMSGMYVKYSDVQSLYIYSETPGLIIINNMYNGVLADNINGVFIDIRRYSPII